MIDPQQLTFLAVAQEDWLESPGLQGHVHDLVQLGHEDPQRTLLVRLHGLPRHALLGAVGTADVGGPGDNPGLRAARAFHDQLHPMVDHVAVDPDVLGLAGLGASVEPEDFAVESLNRAVHQLDQRLVFLALEAQLDVEADPLIHLAAIGDFFHEHMHVSDLRAAQVDGVPRLRLAGMGVAQHDQDDQRRPQQEGASRPGNCPDHGVALSRSVEMSPRPRAFALPGETKSTGPLFGGRPRGLRRAAPWTDAIPINMVENRLALKFNWKGGKAPARGPCPTWWEYGRGGVVRPSADGDVLGEAFARQQLEGPMQRELLGVPRGDLAADDHLALDFPDNEVADSPMRELADVRLDPLRQARPGVRSIENHGVTLGGAAK